MATFSQKRQAPRVVDQRDLTNGLLLSSERTKRINDKFKKDKTLTTYALKRHRCDLITSAVIPDEKTIDNLPIKSQAAYVVCQDKLFYVDKENKTVSQLDVSDSKKQQFIKKLAANNKPRVLSRFELNQIKTKIGHVPKKITCIKMQHPDGKTNIFARYKGEKRGKLIGKGGEGKVKAMQNINTGEWVALKISNYSSRSKSREYEFLEKLGRAQGRIIHTDKQGKQKQFIAMNYIEGRNVEKLIASREIVVCQLSFDQYKQKYPVTDKAIYIYKDHNNNNNLKLRYYDGGAWREKAIDSSQQNAVNAVLKNTHIGDLSGSGIITENDNTAVFLKIREIVGLPTKRLAVNYGDPFDISLTMFDAVAELHSKNIIHRDIKPEQFIYDEKTKKMVLIDVGQAMYAGEKSSVEGTPLYYPLEMIEQNRKNNQHQVKEKFFTKWQQENPTKTKEDFNEFFEKYDNLIGYFRRQWLADNEKKLGVNEWSRLTDAQKQDFINYYDALKVNQQPEYTQYLAERQVFIGSKNKIAKEIEQEQAAKIKFFGAETDIYSLGLSLGNVFGLVDVVSCRQLFKEPQYIHNDDLVVYQIKSIDDARKNNIHHLDDVTLTSLVTLLKSMTDIDPAKRPTLDQAKANLAAIQTKSLTIQQSLATLPTPPIVTKASVEKDSAQDKIKQMRESMKRENHRELPSGVKKATSHEAEDVIMTNSNRHRPH